MRGGSRVGAPRGSQFARALHPHKPNPPPALFPRGSRRPPLRPERDQGRGVGASAPRRASLPGPRRGGGADRTSDRTGAGPWRSCDEPPAQDASGSPPPPASEASAPARSGRSAS